jgi:hypothetical protein
MASAARIASAFRSTAAIPFVSIVITGLTARLSMRRQAQNLREQLAVQERQFQAQLAAQERQFRDEVKREHFARLWETRQAGYLKFLSRLSN